MRAAAIIALVSAVACGGGSVDITLLYDPITCGCDFDEVDLVSGADAVLVVLDGGRVETDFTCAFGNTLDELAANLDRAVAELAPLGRDTAAFDIEIYAPPAVDLDFCDVSAPPVMFGFSEIVELSGDVDVPIAVECDPSPAAFCP